MPFVVLSLVTVFHHEPWRDETRAFQAATTPDNIFHMVRNLKVGDSHPLLWYLIIRLAALVTPHFFSIALVHWAIMLAAMILLFIYSPFKWYQKLLISLGYFMLFDYCVIVRNYGLAVLILFVILVLYSRRFDHPYVFCFLIGLLVNTHPIAIMIAFWIFVLFVWEARVRQVPKACFLIVPIMLAASFYVALRSSGDGVHIEKYWYLSLLSSRPSSADIYYTVKGVINTVFLTVPTPSILYFPHIATTHPGYPLSIALGFLVLVLIIAPRHKYAAMYFWASTLTLIAFAILRGGGGIRHNGFLFVNLLFSLWLNHQYEDQQELPAIPWFHCKLIRNIALAIILAFQVLSGLNACYIEWKHPFSDAMSAGKTLDKIIGQHVPEETLIATFSSGLIEALLPYVSNKDIEFYSLEVMTPYRYLICDDKWQAARHDRSGYGFEKLMKRFVTVVNSQKPKHTYLILSPSPIQTQPRQIATRLQLNPSTWLEMVYMTRRTDLITADERYYIYKLVSRPQTPTQSHPHPDSPRPLGKPADLPHGSSSETAQEKSSTMNRRLK